MTKCSNVIKLLAKDLQPDEDQGGTGLVSRLYFARDLASKLNLAEVKALAATRNAAGKPLSVYHMERLLSVDDPSDRQALLEQCIARNWSVRDLTTAVQNYRGVKKRAGLSPQGLETMGPGVALRDIYLRSREWSEHHKVWFGCKKGTLRRIPRKAHSQELLDELGRAADGLIAVWDSVEQAPAQLESLAREIEGTLATGTIRKER